MDDQPSIGSILSETARLIAAHPVVAATVVLAWAIKSVLEDRFDAWANQWLERLGIPQMMRRNVVRFLAHPTGVPLLIIAGVLVSAYFRGSNSEVLNWSTDSAIVIVATGAVAVLIGLPLLARGKSSTGDKDSVERSPTPPPRIVLHSVQPKQIALFVTTQVGTEFQQKLAGRAWCLYGEFRNEPPSRDPAAAAHGVIARLGFFHEDRKTRLIAGDIDGRWADNEQPRPFVPYRPLQGADFEVSGLAHNLDIAVAFENGTVSATNNEHHLDSSFEPFHIATERFAVRVHLTGPHIDNAWWIAIAVPQSDDLNAAPFRVLSFQEDTQAPHPAERTASRMPPTRPLIASGIVLCLILSLAYGLYRQRSAISAPVVAASPAMSAEPVPLEGCKFHGSLVHGQAELSDCKAGRFFRACVESSSFAGDLYVGQMEWIFTYGRHLEHTGPFGETRLPHDVIIKRACVSHPGAVRINGTALAGLPLSAGENCTSFCPNGLQIDAGTVVKCECDGECPKDRAMSCEVTAYLQDGS